jgi:hypothetical protein
MVCLFHSDYGPADPAFKFDPGSTVGVRGWIVSASSFKEARNIGEVEAIQRQLLADGVPVVLGTRAFDLLLVLLEADGLLVTKRRAPQPGVAKHRGVGREPQGTGVCAAQSARRRPRCHPNGIRPRLPIHRHALLEWRGARLSISHATKAAVWPNSVSTELSAIAPV